MLALEFGNNRYNAKLSFSYGLTTEKISNFYGIPNANLSVNPAHQGPLGIGSIETNGGK